MTDQELFAAADQNGERFLYNADPIPDATGFIPAAGTMCIPIPTCVVSPHLTPFDKVRVRLQTYGVYSNHKPPEPEPVKAEFWALKLPDKTFAVDENGKLRTFDDLDQATGYADEHDELDYAVAVRFVAEK